MIKLPGTMIPNKQVFEKVGFIFGSYNNGQYDTELPRDWKIISDENNKEWLYIYDEFNRKRGLIQQIKQGDIVCGTVRLQPRYRIVDRFINECNSYEVSLVDSNNNKIYTLTSHRNDLSINNIKHVQRIYDDAASLFEYMEYYANDRFPGYKDPSNHWNNEKLNKNKVKVRSL